jgi:hypothetical protein
LPIVTSSISSYNFGEAFEDAVLFLGAFLGSTAGRSEVNSATSVGSQTGDSSVVSGDTISRYFDGLLVNGTSAGQSGSITRTNSIDVNITISSRKVASNRGSRRGSTFVADTSESRSTF